MLLRPVLMPILRNPLQGIADGIRNMLAELLGSSQFFAPLTHSLVLSRGTGSPTFTRAATKTIENNDGYLVTLLAGEIGFPGARRVRNLLSGSENINSWVGTATVTTGVSDPDGGTSAFTITTVGGGTERYLDSSITSGVASSIGAQLLNSVYIRRRTGTGNVLMYNGKAGSGFTNITSSLTSSWQRLATPKTAPLASVTNSRIGFFLTTAGDEVDVWHPQCEDVTAQTTQTAGEYVSVGVESAPYYHGSFVDGVKCFPTDLDGNPLPTSYTYDAVSLNGVVGTYVSTPDSAAASVTGDIDIRVKVMLNTWSSDVILVAKNAVTGTYQLDQTSSRLRFTRWGPTVTATASAAVSFSNGTTGWVRATYSTTTGKVNFYESADGSTWTPVGTEQTITAAAINDTTDAVSLFANGTGGGATTSGKIYQAQIYNGIDGTLAVDFDASRYAGGTTLTGSTGETWTLQGNAVIHPTNNPMLGYLAEGARTNLCLQSNAFTTTWVNDGLIPVQNSIGPDGGTTAWTLDDSAGGAIERIYQTGITLTAATYTMSVFIEKTSTVPGANSYPLIYATQGANIALATIDPVNGTATVWTTYSGPATVTSSARCTSYNSTYWRVELTFLATAAAWIVAILPAAAAQGQSTGVESAAGVGSQVFYGAQLELGSFASSYIPTTTAAVTRAADVDSVPTASNILAAASTVCLEFTPDHTPSGTIALWGTYVDASNYTAILHDATNMIMRKRIAGVNYDATIANAFTANTTYKVCGSWGASGVTVTLDGTEGTANANTTAAQIAATMQWGADGNSLQQPFATERNARVWQRQLSTSERGAITA